uniref:(northern house mosquito) hypothetical protein n=1 Tax=Culex pipiens TaxID=7175 RepID=A0A8D8CL18_CULPI
MVERGKVNAWKRACRVGPGVVFCFRRPGNSRRSRGHPLASSRGMVSSPEYAIRSNGARSKLRSLETIRISTSWPRAASKSSAWVSTSYRWTVTFLVILDVPFRRTVEPKLSD